ncbi:hypothetical protein D3C78_1178080 [compost metagenome]
MGAPVARLFFEPQNTMAISSSTAKPSRRLSQVVASSAMASSRQQASVSSTSAGPGTARHRPPITAALKAVYTTSRIEPWSTYFSQAL